MWDFDKGMKKICNEIQGVWKKVPQLVQSLEFLLECYNLVLPTNNEHSLKGHYIINSSKLTES